MQQTPSHQFNEDSQHLVTNWHAHAQTIVSELRSAYPNAKSTLSYSNHFELLMATILSTNCDDESVNEVTAHLFKMFPTPQELAATERVHIEMVVRPLGFARQKAKSLQLASRFLVDEFGGVVPNKMQDLMRLPGVSRKIANIVLGEGFGRAQGLAVDNQVKRVVRRLGLADGRSVEAVEQKLLRIIPAEHWFEFSLLASRHGEVVCLVRQPKCAGCQLKAICPSAKA